MAGDSGNFDLLVSEETTMAGKYSSTFVTDDKVTIKMNAAITAGDYPTIIHEQHSVPSGLRGVVNVVDERIAAIYLSFSDVTGELTQKLGDRVNPNDPSDLSVHTVADDGTVYVRVAKPPIRNRDDGETEKLANDNDDIPDAGSWVELCETGNTCDATPGSNDSSIIDVKASAAGVIKLKVDKEGGLDGDDSIRVSYHGSDSFTFDVEHGPIHDLSHGDAGTAYDATKIVVPAPDDDQRDANRIAAGTSPASNGNYDARKVLAMVLSLIRI